MANKTPFYDLHLKRNAEIIEHAGWLMPQHFGNAQEEHIACRQHLAVCDLSHFYRIRVSGPYAAKTLNQILTCDITTLPVERQCVALVCNSDGNIIEQLHVQHQEKDYLLIGHPQNHQRILDILQKNAPKHGLKISDETQKTALVSLQGPNALQLLKEKLPFDLGSMTPNDIIVQSYFFMKFIISFSEGGPEPGVYLIMPAKAAGMAWEMLAKYGESYGAKIAGLDAQNSLRIEAATPAIEAEFNETIDPFTANLDKFVDLDKEDDFTGAQALKQLAAQSPKQKLVGLTLPAQTQTGETLLVDQKEIGKITSTCFSPTLNQHIALAFIDADLDQQPIQTKSNNQTCTITPLPFVNTKNT